MKLAFVLRLGNESRPDQGGFEGWIQEVDICIELRFRSAEQLLSFLRQRFERAKPSLPENSAPDRGNESW